MPLISALVTAFFLEPIVRILTDKWTKRRNLSVFITFLLFTLFLAFSLYFISTKLITEAVNFIDQAPRYMNQLSMLWQTYEREFTNAAENLPKEVVDTITGQIDNLLASIQASISNTLNIQKVTALLAYIPNYLVSILVYLIALFLFMVDLPRLKMSIFQHLTEKTADKVNFMTSRLNYVIFGFLKAQFLVSIIIFVVSLIGLLFIAPEIAILMSIIIWVIDFIPLLGSIIVLAPWSLLELINGNSTLAAQLAVLAVILLIIRRTVEPKVMGSHIGLSPLATLIAMYLGLKIIGVLGFVVGPLIIIIWNSAKEAGIIKWNFKI